MKKILLIKLTSIGDLIHVLPALTDAMNVYPEIQIDWIIDENFAEIASWHKAVDQIFTTDHRKWRKNLFSAFLPILKLVKSIRKTNYDLIIDGQGNFKSALLSLCTKGIRAGFDRHSAREWIASLAYNRKFPASKKAHAIDRLRQLFALALNYPIPKTLPNFSIRAQGFTPPSLELPSNYLMFIHSAAWETKLWQEDSSKKLMEILSKKGHSILLPWGTSKEHERAIRLSVNDQIKVLPKLSLSELAVIISKAQGCISVDTGLSHLSGALSVPTVTLYGATDPGIIGACGKNQFHIRSTLSCSPCSKKKCQLKNPTPLKAPCMSEISPEQVASHLLKILGGPLEKPALDICNKPCGSYKER